MNKEFFLRAILFLVIFCLRPLGYLLSEGHIESGPKDFVYDLD
jgi:hypothetical protein